eukprot:CAMPEP_0198270340 /NCGR_PEP_ID=MMETSP1447-20131203/44737_1 /TAXON_ID=420782 /ORGANISM="Chaetoceros dichaeta, Strain CCMP1751" /LENGTH=103 /DNA_ID=CAMNT_0043962321 /DNA_START=44 /DNA_END=356 /DNA_ORIENTATION=-
MSFSSRASEEDLADAAWGDAGEGDPTANAGLSVSSNMSLSTSTVMSDLSAREDDGDRDFDLTMQLGVRGLLLTANLKLYEVLQLGDEQQWSLDQGMSGLQLAD